MRRLQILILHGAGWFFLALPLVAAPPVISQQPTDKSVVAGNSVSFSVAVSGTAPLSLQWFKSNALLAGATNFSVTITNAQLADAGPYHVRVTNSGGFTISSNATLTVVADTFAPGVSKVRVPGNFNQITVTFTERVMASDAVATSNYALDQGLSVVGAALAPDGFNANLTLSPALIEGVSYTLAVQNIHDVFGNLMQPNPTQITFLAALAPSIVTQPVSLAAAMGESASFQVVASGTGPLSYQWFRSNRFQLGNSPMAGATAASYVINNIQLTNLATYFVVVSNSAGYVVSAPAQLTLAESSTLDLPAGYSFITRQLSNAPTSFPTPPDGTTINKWEVGSQSYGSTYSYLDGAGWDPAPFALALGEGAVINLPVATRLTFTGLKVAPTPRALSPGLNLIGAQTPFVAGYTGIVGTSPSEGAFVYRFRSGQNPAELSGDNFQFSFYRYGRWHDQVPEASVGEAVFVGYAAPVIITTQPGAQTNLVFSQPASFSVTASGAAPLRYQWRLNGGNIPGATNRTYALAAADYSDVGEYSVLVGNLVGDTSSVTVPLKFSNLVPITMTDDYGLAPVLGDFSRVLASHNRNATRQPGEPLHAGKRAPTSVWLTWVAPASGNVTMSTAGSSFDTVLAAYTGNSFSNHILVDADDDGARAGCSQIDFPVVAGIAYHIGVAGVGGTTGDILLRWDLTPTAQVFPIIAAQPEDASVPLGSTALFSLVVSNVAHTVQWFHHGSPLGGATSDTLTITNVNEGDVGYYSARITTAFGYQRNSAAASLQIETPEVGSAATGLRATAKFFDLVLPNAVGTPLNAKTPKLGGTVAHGYSGAQTFSTVGAGNEPDEPNHCDIAGGNSVWYVIQAETNGTMYINTDGSSFDTVLAAYIGPGVDFITLTNVACDNNSGLDGHDSRTSFAATAGTIYYIAVDGVGSASGTVKFRYQLVRPLTMSSFSYTNGASPKFIFKITGTPNLGASVQASTNLASTNWTTLQSTTNSTGIFNFTNTGISALTNRAYRAVNKF